MWHRKTLFIYRQVKPVVIGGVKPSDKIFDLSNFKKGKLIATNAGIKADFYK